MLKRSRCFWCFHLATLLDSSERDSFVIPLWNSSETNLKFNSDKIRRHCNFLGKYLFIPFLFLVSLKFIILQLSSLIPVLNWKGRKKQRNNLRILLRKLLFWQLCDWAKIKKNFFGNYLLRQITQFSKAWVSENRRLSWYCFDFVEIKCWIWNNPSSDWNLSLLKGVTPGAGNSRHTKYWRLPETHLKLRVEIKVNAFITPGFQSPLFTHL